MVLFLRLLIVCSIALALISTGQTGPVKADDAESGQATGLIPLTSSQREWMNKYFPPVAHIELNELALKRINTERESRGLQRLIDEVKVVHMGNELTFAAAANTAAIETGKAPGPVPPNILPGSVDNSTLPSFPPIRSQGFLGSCTAWALTYYQFTYETNLARGGTAGDGDNSAIFSPKWTYNMINGGNDKGANYADAYSLLMKNGAATWEEFPYDNNYLEWCLNTETWRNALNYKLQSCGQITNTGDDSFILGLKTQLTNGHVPVISTFVKSWVKNVIGDDPATANDDGYCGQWIASYKSIPETGGHAMTVVGYDDSIWCDINENNMVDFGEKGAFKIANSWGTSDWNKGFRWVSYDSIRRVSAVPETPSWPQADRSSTGIFGFESALTVTARPDYSPQMVAELTLNQLNRGQLSISLGIGDITSESPALESTTGALVFSGGNYAFDGTKQAVDGTFVFDFPDLASAVKNESRWFAGIKDNLAGDSTIIKSFKLYAVTQSGDVLVRTCSDLPVLVDSQKKYVALDYSPTFSRIPLPYSQFSVGTSIDQMAGSPDGGAVFVYSNANTTLYRSVDGGKTWSITSSDTFSNGLDGQTVVSLAVSSNFAADHTVAAATAHELYVSNDGGDLFGRDLALPSGLSINAIGVGPGSASQGGGMIILAGTATGLLVYSSLEDLWQEQADPAFFPDPGDRLQAGSVIGVAFSPNFLSDAQVLAVVAPGTTSALHFRVINSALTDRPTWDHAGGLAAEAGSTACSLPHFSNPSPSEPGVSATAAVLAFPLDYNMDDQPNVFVGFNGSSTLPTNGIDGVWAANYKPAGAGPAVSRNMGAYGRQSGSQLFVYGGITSLAVADWGNNGYLFAGKAQALPSNAVSSTNGLVAWCNAKYGAISWNTCALTLGTNARVVAGPETCLAGTAGACSGSALFEMTGSAFFAVAMVSVPALTNLKVVNIAPAGTQEIFIMVKAGFLNWVFRTVDCGKNWAGIYAGPDLMGVYLSPDYVADLTVYIPVSGASAPSIKVSSDHLYVFHDQPVSCASPITAFLPLSRGTYCIGYSDGLNQGIYIHGNQGAITGVPYSIARGPGSEVFVGTTDGKVFISSDAGLTFYSADQPAPSSGVQCPGRGPISVLVDPDYSNNKTIYAFDSAGAVPKSFVVGSGAGWLDLTGPAYYSPNASLAPDGTIFYANALPNGSIAHLLPDTDIPYELIDPNIILPTTGKPVAPWLAGASFDWVRVISARDGNYILLALTGNTAGPLEAGQNGAGSPSYGLVEITLFAHIQEPPEAIALSPLTPETIVVGQTLQFTAAAVFSDALIKDITFQAIWSSSKPSRVTISPAGLAAGAAVGKAEITAALDSVSSLPVKIEVIADILNSIEITPSGPVDLPVGSTRQFKATGAYNSSFTLDITSRVSWNSSNNAVAVISAGGLATGIAAGNSEITAVLDGLTSPSISLDVSQGSTKITLSSSPNPSVYTLPVVFTALVSVISPAAGTPAGFVLFRDGPAELGTAALSSSGQAACAVSALSPGNHTIQAEYSGDGNFTASASPALVQAVDQTPAYATLASSPNPSSSGESVTFTVTLSPALPDAGIPSGAVVLKDGGQFLQTILLDSAGKAQYTTAGLGVDSHTITAEYAGDGLFAGTVSEPLIQVVGPPQLRIITLTLPDGDLDSFYSQVIQAVNGEPPYVWSIDQITGRSRPSGLTLSRSKGILRGTPKKPGTYTFTLRVTDSANPPASTAREFPVTIHPAVTITHSGSIEAEAGVALTDWIPAARGGSGIYSWTIARGTLPVGLSFNDTTGQISGTPGDSLTAAVSRITLKVSDSLGGSASATLKLQVYPLLSVTTLILPGVDIGVKYKQAIRAAGGKKEYSWSIVKGSLPMGLTLENGSITGLPLEGTSGKYAFTLQVSDGLGSAPQEFSITVNPPLVITLPPEITENLKAGTDCSFSLIPSGGSGAGYSWSKTGRLPPGLKLDRKNGRISGIPQKIGDYQFTLKLTDSLKGSIIQPVTLKIR